MQVRVVVHSVLIALPAVALCLAGAYFLADKVPKIERARKSAITREYREVADAMRRDAMVAQRFGSRKKGWSQTGRIGRRDGMSIPWGHLPVEGGELVWCGDDAKRVAISVVPTADLPDDTLFLRTAVVATLAIAVLMTVVGVWYFVRTNKSREDFLLATVHDLTTPIVAMRRLIGRDDDYALAMCERMERLVKNVSDFLRLGGERRALHLETFTVGSVFFEAYHMFAVDFAAEKSGAVKVIGDTDLRISADRLMTMQILWNLLGNDLKYAAPFGPVEMRIARNRKMVSISIADYGHGMGKHAMRHAFDRYYRERTAMDTGKGGFGIGLCTSLEFARLMGGDLVVAANRPKGCVFTLMLPSAEED